MKKNAIQFSVFPKKIECQQKILQLLEHASTPMSLSQLQAATNIRSRQTVLSYVQELATVIQRYAPTDQLQLTIQANKGIQLQRFNTNLTVIKQQLYANTLVYKIMYQLLLFREFPAQKFCEQQGISFSKLRRQIKKMNQALSLDNLKIKVGEQVKIVGNEWQLRFLLVLFFYKVNHGLPASLSDQAKPQWRAAQVFTEVFHWEKEQSLIEVLVLILFVNECSKEELENLPLKYEQARLAEGLSVEQQQVLCVLEALDLVPMASPTFKESPIQLWLQCLQALGGKLTAKECVAFEQFERQQDLWRELFFEPKDWLWPVASVNTSLTKQQNHYAQVLFEMTWQLFKDSENCHFSKQYLWQAYLQIMPKKCWVRPLSIYLLSALPQRIKFQMQEQMTTYFAHDYQLTFVSAIEQAQLIVSTECAHLITDIPIVWIEAELFASDWLQLTHFFQTMNES